MNRAAFACDPDRSRGRLHPEAPSATRTAFQRDRDRVIHSAAFRRLMHKTQVFVAVEGDHFRTRLTHSLEVAQIARSVARVLGLDEDLTEVLALSHDLGHTAFGHAGEDALDARMEPWGGFDHNAQALRIVTHLEQRYPAFDGLNLSWETLEGLVKHNGPVTDPPWAIRDYQQRQDLWLASHASLEAQVAAIADDIAYNNHDLDDGLRANLFSVEDACQVPLVARCWAATCDRWPDAEQSRRTAELVRQMIGVMIDDLIAATRSQLQAMAPQSADDVRHAGRTLASFSPEMQGQERALKQFLRERMYRHVSLGDRAALAERVIGTLFDLYLDDPARLPDGGKLLHGATAARKARMVCDFIAGCTDRYALKLHDALLA